MVYHKKYRSLCKEVINAVIGFVALDIVKAMSLGCDSSMHWECARITCVG